MGKQRSNRGCLTCRKRHVKCDEVRPKCGQCQKRDRVCLQEEAPGLEFRTYQFDDSGSFLRISTAESIDESSNQQNISLPQQFLVANAQDEPPQDPDYTSYRSGQGPNTSPLVSSMTPFTAGPYRTPSADVPLIGSPLETPSRQYGACGYSISQLLQHVSPSVQTIPSPSETSPLRLTYREAELVHHFSQHLGRWLDCTDASRQFTLKIPRLVKTYPILLYAVVSYAATHVKDAETAESAHEKCVELLIPLLSSEHIAYDDVLLCTIVVLRVFEQLNVMVTGSDHERHLAGCTALLKASQGREIDLSAPTLRQAAFWVYARQCLYNACVNQQPPNIDTGLVLLPKPAFGSPDHELRSETAWANHVTWICATIIHFCFSNSFPEPGARLEKWNELSQALADWMEGKPSSFEPIWYSDSGSSDDHPFPIILFTADWHVMAYGFYHLASMLLLIYKPFPRFAIRKVQRELKDADAQVMMHVRAICGACKCSQATVPSLITLCHSTFIWAPLMTDTAERQEVLQMLLDMEKKHAWPTTWIINSLKEEWASS
ncbi:hypothetical protein PV08_07892 [Exophiala spinifera]|uniref:Zn(2)-C6 fungal-type domain-containing protein n=1 Tax=Exophiala spinifera TaxID=91928 RepID=A0A0D2B8X4_9EURO|nr:uncharacterized protein PV08_07892 [Exophiala spinifera]KIW15105.1 hypothetical protein PV08_07892 [Exophiala spinifera]